MKKLLRLSLIVAALFIILQGSAFAILLGQNITAYDGLGSGTGWYGAQEDQEIEPNCVASQQWDLEGFYLNGTNLTMVGGYNFKDGQSAGGYTYRPGDIFINIDPKNQTNGYDYAIALDFSNNQTRFSVYKITDTTRLQHVYYQQNLNSDPWKYNPTQGDLMFSGIFTYYSGLADSEVGGLLGGSHNAVVLDLAFLTSLNPDFNGQFTAHYTMECGNDNLMGAAPVPEPTTLLLVGSGLIGLAAFRRRK